MKTKKTLAAALAVTLGVGALAFAGNADLFKASILEGDREAIEFQGEYITFYAEEEVPAKILFMLNRDLERGKARLESYRRSANIIPPEPVIVAAAPEEIPTDIIPESNLVAAAPEEIVPDIPQPVAETKSANWIATKNLLDACLIRNQEYGINLVATVRAADLAANQIIAATDAPAETTSETPETSETEDTTGTTEEAPTETEVPVVTNPITIGDAILLYSNADTLDLQVGFQQCLTVEILADNAAGQATNNTSPSNTQTAPVETTDAPAETTSETPETSETEDTTGTTEETPAETESAETTPAEETQTPETTEETAPAESEETPETEATPTESTETAAEEPVEDSSTAPAEETQTPETTEETAPAA